MLGHGFSGHLAGSGIAGAALHVVLLGLACTPATSSAPRLSGPGTRVRVDTLFYAVPGATPVEWQAFINEHGPGERTPRHAALTRWTIAPRYQLRGNGSECRPSAAFVELTVTLELPRLDDPGGARAADRAEWDRFIRHLTRHEHGHVVRAAWGASALADSLRRLRAPTCAAAGRAAGAAYREVVAQCVAAQRAYDSRTRHGARQGVNLPSANGIRFDEDTTLVDTLRLGSC
jgi:predicted secreted Zn-dependent protease